MTRWRRSVMSVLVAFALAAAAHAAWAQSEKRVALVIGNNAYRHVRSLEKTLNDARAVAGALRDVGFEVLERENLDRRGMNQALTEFVERISGGGVGVFYYAGHGVQIGGSNYLIPVDEPALGNAEELRDDAIDLGRILERLTEAKAKLDIVILDACRDDPFPKVAGRSLGGTRGLAIPAAPNGILILYSAGVNQIALDTLGPSDNDPNGLFTRKLLPLIEKPGLRLDEAVRRIRREVSAAARSVGQEQNPAIYDQTDGDFYFVQSTPPSVPRALPYRPLPPAVVQLPNRQAGTAPNPPAARECERSGISMNGCQPGATGGRLHVIAGRGDFAAISMTNKTLNVPPGAALNGTIRLDALNLGPPDAVAPLIYTPSWGDHSSSWRLVQNWLPSGESDQTARVSLQVPGVPGVYHIIFAFAWEIGGDHVASATNWSTRTNRWNDGHNIAELDASQLAEAQLKGYISTDWYFGTGYSHQYIPVDALTLVVGAPQ
ncbi:MAG TPA: caspase family protein [Alphaproteobacteria bacterium]|nr:caspase family protein [Alphaproteobacteria bacterium]